MEPSLIGAENVSLRNKSIVLLSAQSGFDLQSSTLVETLGHTVLISNTLLLVSHSTL